MTKIRGLSPGEYYHIFNRGAHKSTFVHEKSDWMRLLFLILHLQSPLLFLHSGRIARSGSVTDGFGVGLQIQESVISERFVEVVAFCLMPNHFHLLLKEIEKGGIARYMQRVQLSYTKYFNERYQSSGAVFQGRYGSVHVKDDRQLMHLSAYIHRNPRELRQWRGKEEMYPYSSLQDYIDKNRWGGLLATDIIAGRFEGSKTSNYRDFVRTSPAKMLEEEFGNP